MTKIELFDIDLELEMKVHNVCHEAIIKGIIKSAHDLSDGGLSTTVAECLLASKLSNAGAKLDISRKLRNDEILFGECQSSIIVTLAESQLLELVLIAQDYDVPTQSIGKVTNDGILKINNLIKLSVSDIESVYNNSLEKLINQSNELLDLIIHRHRYIASEISIHFPFLVFLHDHNDHEYEQYLLLNSDLLFSSPL